MTAPAITAVAEGSWTKVATNVTAATINILKYGGVVYAWTYRDTGDPAPTSAAGQVKLMPNKPLVVQAVAGVDLYLWAKNGAGSVRVDVGINADYLLDG